MALSISCGVLKGYRWKRLNFSRGIQLREDENRNNWHFRKKKEKNK